jgi:hypothetical protein
MPIVASLLVFDYDGEPDFALLGMRRTLSSIVLFFLATVRLFLPWPIVARKWLGSNARTFLVDAVGLSSVIIVRQKGHSHRS